MIKFNSTNFPSNKIVYIILDRTYTCQNSWTAELVKNLSDYVLSNILVKGYNVLQGIDEDSLLKEASNKYEYAVVLSTGTEFINGNAFFKLVEEYVLHAKDFFLMGHIPDRDDGYYELHEQCYLINLKKYKKLNYPTIGEFEFYSSHTQVEPVRSPYNIHDDYTPVWVRWGERERKYKHKWHGWNILSVAFANQENVQVFSEDFRNNKKYYYPNYEPAFIPASSYLYGKYSVASQTLFYPYNTEKLSKVKFQGPIRQLVIQASGLQWYSYLLEHGYDQNTVVRFVDYNLFALECMQYLIVSWDGTTDYLELIQLYANTRASLVGKDGADWLSITDVKQDIDIDKWLDIQRTVKFEYRHEDIVLDTSLNVNKWIDNLPNTIIHLSHIFNYDPASTFVSLKYRIYSERILLEKLKKYVPDATVIMIGKVSENVQYPTWHMNGDLNGI